jgi:L-alanine-DL-glutamate epimerase-like enolase superfamily enzyme/GNAT superfamily N-acetyltransferase
VIRIRPARIDEGRMLATIFVAAWRGGYPGVVPDDVIDAQTVDSVADEFLDLAAPGLLQTAVAVGDNDDPIGFTRYGPDQEHRAGGYLAALYVHPGVGGGGVGTALVDHVLRALPGREIRLWVFESNARARSLYERLGFRPDGAWLVDPRWRTPQMRYLRPARTEPRSFPPLRDVDLGKVIGVDVAPLVRPMRRTFRTALREVHELRALRVELRTSGGLSGVGTTVATPEITGDPEEALLVALRGPLVGAARGARSLLEALRAVAAVPGVPAARAAVDVALHDLAARRIGGWRNLLGDAGPASTAMTLAVDTPDAMAAQAKQAVAAGFTSLKIKVADAEGDVERIRGVARAGADAAVRLRVDANQAWTPEQAVRILDEVHTAGISLEMLEQPVRAADLDGMAFIRQRCLVPLLADECAFTAADVTRVASAGAADMVCVKLLKAGGLHPARAMIDAAAAAGLGVIVGCMLEPAEGVLAAARLAAAGTEGPFAHDLDAPWWVDGGSPDPAVILPA